MADQKLSSENGMMLIGIFTLFGSWGFYVFDNYSMALLLLFLGLILTLLGYWQFKRKNVGIKLVIIFLIAFYLSTRSLDQISNYMNQNAAIQKICGSVENIKIVQGRGTSTFDLIGKESQQTFSYYEYQSIVNSSSHLCIDYSFDKRWSRYPYIVEIYPQSHQ